MATLGFLLSTTFFATFFTDTEPPFVPMPTFIALFINNSFSTFFNSLVA